MRTLDEILDDLRNGKAISPDEESRAEGERPQGATPLPNPFHVMVDIETFATGPAAFPIAIGATKFDSTKPAAGPEATRWDQFYVAIDPQQGPALAIDSATILWWMAREQREALDKWLDAPKVGLHEALAGFCDWYGDTSLPTWTNGPAFDAVILETAHKACGLKRPWTFRHDRDCRTIRRLMPAEWEPAQLQPGRPVHDALGDATRQTYELLAIARELGLTLR